LSESAPVESALIESALIESASPSRLWLVRHAQASFGSPDYDALSERGEHQAGRLAEWLVAHPDLCFTHVVGGTMRRHAQTLAPIIQAFAAAGRALPAAAPDPDWNEFDHEAVIRAWANQHVGDPVLVTARSGADRRAIHALLTAALRAWAAGELDGAVPETWDAFGARVARARARLQAWPRGKVLVVSSGGPITRCAQAALGCDTARTIALNLALRNTAVSEFHDGDGGWQLHIWNMLPHLSSPQEREWVTYY
jgi:broad specificity phosphatase PhoE